ncbi:MAG TPA: adenylyl-sulfate kinase [Stellaceae bacterium]|nr:adenylyl-sulfate kinase [Stellaceae bacterium]
MSEDRTLPIVIVGHVDHGKSTLIGRLLHDTGSLPEGKVAALQEASRKRGMPFEWSFVMDALKVERDQGITIDTTRMRFKSERRDYVIIDAPGHAEFLKNMLTGAAAAEAAILVVDVIEGLSEQTRRHAFLLQLLGIREIVVAVNKMDRCGWTKEPFAAVSQTVADYLAGLDLAPSAIIPISARNGDMIAHRSVPPSWYDGPTVLQALDALHGAPSEVDRPLRLPVQDVYKFDDRRIVVGRIESGRLRVGDRLRFSPGGRSARIASIESWNAQAAVTAGAGQSVGLTLDEDIFVERGQVASAPEAVPLVARRLKLRLFYFGHAPLQAGDTVKLQIGLAEQAATVEAIDSVVDIGDFTHRRAAAVGRNDIADIVVRCCAPLAVEAAADGRHLGRGILRRGYQLVAGFQIGAVLDAPVPAAGATRHITPAVSAMSATERSGAWGHAGGVLWLTGLSGAGKSTLALALERELFRRDYRVILLDGDSLRRTLNADLGFSEAERAENVRRIGAVAQHLAESGLIAIVACIAPRRSHRVRLRNELGALYHEVYVKASLDACERRDVKGLYAKARRGEIASFTGVSDLYEPPTSPELELGTEVLTPAECLGHLTDYFDRTFRVGEVRRLAS